MVVGGKSSPPSPGRSAHGGGGGAAGGRGWVQPRRGKRIIVCGAVDSRLRGNDKETKSHCHTHLPAAPYSSQGGELKTGDKFPSVAGAFRPLRGGVAAKRTGWVQPRRGKRKKTKNKGDIMKNVLVVSLMLLMPCVGGALDMCVRDSAMVVSLDPAVNGAGSHYNVSEMTWDTVFSYGTIYGEATCLSDADGTPSESAMGVYTNSKGEMLPNDDTFVQRKDGGHCWCRMTHPASSRWVFFNSYSASTCASNCASNCGNNAQGNAALRGGLFGSVGK